MKTLETNQMENARGGAYVDCVLMVAGFAGAVASSSTGIGITLAAFSFVGGVRSAMACDGSTTWF